MSLLAIVLAAAVVAPADQTCRMRDFRGEIVRSTSRRAAFLRATGYPNGRPGWIADHLVPLAPGFDGCDVTSNFEWLTEAEWKRKTGWERRCPECWRDGTYTRLIQYALDGCVSGTTPKDLCAAILGVVP